MFLLSTFIASKVLDSAESSKQCYSSEQQTSPERDEPLTPLNVAPEPNANLKDDWGHFAYFQEELADESSFIPSTCAQSKTTLGTLDEGEEEDDEGGLF